MLQRLRLRFFILMLWFYKEEELEIFSFGHKKGQTANSDKEDIVLKQQFVVEEGEQDLRIDKYLAGLLEGLSRSYIQKLLKSQAVFVNGKPVKGSYKVCEDDEIVFEVPEASEPEILAEPMNLDILYEDSDILIVNKPKDMVVHPAAGHYTGTLVNGLMYHCQDSLSGINGFYVLELSTALIRILPVF